MPQSVQDLHSGTKFGLANFLFNKQSNHDTMLWHLINTAMALFYMNAAKRVHNRSGSETKLPLQPKGSTKSSNARNKPSNFVNTQINGVLETGIIAELGHFDRPARAASSNVAKTVTEMDEIAELNRSFSFSRNVNNRILDIIDPNWHKTLSSIRPLIARENSSAALILGVDDSLVISHTITWNRQIDSHFDSKDCVRGWAALHVAVTLPQSLYPVFTTSYAVLHILKLCVQVHQ
ncbi:hypothetical protein Clacol_005200 [Clathrus columnatus]|uniref:Uncharacterized protein n=1 Tax=Clathrus columnatus TaxID=1419009 RepID=A0AAV5AEN0_9AGAM|nr:hypothetical protein Clacol_005200 [Clathrus columnatus]